MMDKKDLNSWSKSRRNTIDIQGTPSQSRIKISNSGRMSMKDRNKNRISLGFGDASESLLAMLQHPAGIETFRTFLQSEFSEENLDFWLECESYRQQKPHRIHKHALKIFHTYLEVNAPKEVNLDASSKTRTLTLLKSPDKNTFIVAQRHIFQLMESDSFRRFMSSNNNNRKWK